MPKIVVSYRRADTGPIAGRIFDRLGTHYGFESVFMDVDNIPFGVDFREHIQQELSHCDILIVIIGPRWLGAGEDGRARINDETDPVRIEVETAMRGHVPVIPILVDNATMPKPADLPDSLRDFAFRNAAEVDAAGRDFRQHMERVIRSIDQILARRVNPSMTAPALPDEQAVAPLTTPQSVPTTTSAAAAQSPPALGPVSSSGAPRSTRTWVIGAAGLAALAIVAGAAVMIAANRENQPPIVSSPGQSPPPVTAQPIDYPTKPVRIIVPYAAGGPTDALGRVVSDDLTARFGQTFVVENRPGANGTLGMQQVVSASADGYGLGLAGTLDFLNGYFYRNLAYDPFRDLAPVALIGRTPSVLVVPPTLPVTTLRELIAHAKANPGKVTYGSFGAGSWSHLGAVQLERAAGLDLVHVPNRSTAAAIADLLAGKVNMMHAPLAVVHSHIQSGRLRALAVVSAERWRETLPAVPTTIEAGIPDYDFETWYGLVAPRSVPRPVLEKLNLVVREMIADPVPRKRLADNYLRATSDEFASLLSRDLPKLERIIREQNIRFD